jgi:F0F1-type ATP synthase gamma subunit
MESTTQNVEELIEELMLSVRAARRQALTREMQELATSAGSGAKRAETHAEARANEA